MVIDTWSSSRTEYALLRNNLNLFTGRTSFVEDQNAKLGSYRLQSSKHLVRERSG